MHLTGTSKRYLRLVLVLLLIAGAVWKMRQPTRNEQIETPRLKALAADPLLTHLPGWVHITKIDQNHAYPIPRGDGGGWVDNHVGVLFDLDQVVTTPEQRVTDWAETLVANGWTLEGSISCPPKLSIEAHKQIAAGIASVLVQEEGLHGGLSVSLTGKTDRNPYQPQPLKARTTICLPAP
jgi:hypothetical protein